MKRLINWTILTALLIAVGAVLPAPAVAAPCTDGYEQCLNDSHDKRGLAEYMANLECGARYVGCVRKALMS